MRTDISRLNDILKAIEKIEKYKRRGEAEFRSEELIQVWCIHHLQLIGEAARALSDDTRESLDTVPWREIIGMRHILVHHYFGVDLDVVWDAIAKELGPLKAEIETAIEHLDQENSQN